MVDKPIAAAISTSTVSRVAVGKDKRAALYLRVSTDRQDTANQREALEEVATHRGWTVVAVYEDAGINGAKGRDKRPGLDAILKDASRAKFDVVMAWSVDHMGRSLQDLLATVQELRAARVDLFLHQQALDTTTPAGTAMFQMCGVFAEFERAMIQARIHAGIARARTETPAQRATKGKRAHGRPRIAEDVERAVLAELATGKGTAKVGKLVGLSSSTVRRIRDEAAAQMQEAA